MEDESVKVSHSISRRTLRGIEDLARAENRSRSNMLDQLLREALANRKAAAQEDVA